MLKIFKICLGENVDIYLFLKIYKKNLQKCLLNGEYDEKQRFNAKFVTTNEAGGANV